MTDWLFFWLFLIELKQQNLTSFIPSSLPRLLVPRRGGNAASCHPAAFGAAAHGLGSPTFNPRARLLLLRLSSRCFARDFLIGTVTPSSSGSLWTSQRDGDLNLRLGLVGEVTGEVSLWTRVPNMVIIDRPNTATTVISNLLDSRWPFRRYYQFCRCFCFLTFVTVDTTYFHSVERHQNYRLYDLSIIIACHLMIHVCCKRHT